MLKVRFQTPPIASPSTKAIVVSGRSKQVAQPNVVYARNTIIQQGVTIMPVDGVAKQGEIAT